MRRNLPYGVSKNDLQGRFDHRLLDRHRACNRGAPVKTRFGDTAIDSIGRIW
jgi:hypothetical protein